MSVAKSGIPLVHAWQRTTLRTTDFGFRQANEVTVGSSCVVRFNGLSVAVWRLALLAVFLAAAPSANAADISWRNPDRRHVQQRRQLEQRCAGRQRRRPFRSQHPGPFGTLPPYTVSFTADATNTRLVVEDDRVIFDLNGHTYNTTSVLGADIGTVSGSSGGLTVTDGTLSLALGSDLAIGADSSGFLTVSTGGRVIGNPFLFVGGSGAGTLTVQNGGELLADDTQIGDGHAPRARRPSRALLSSYSPVN